MYWECHLSLAQRTSDFFKICCDLYSPANLNISRTSLVRRLGLEFPTTYLSYDLELIFRVRQYPIVVDLRSFHIATLHESSSQTIGAADGNTFVGMNALGESSSHLLAMVLE